MTKYQPKNFEKKWIEVWEKEKIYTNKKIVLDKNINPKKQYVLSMFPYPSGAGLHVGHVRIYTGTDVLARFFRMNGYSVLHPMGWDAFGLPAENAAIKAKKNPMEMVPQNIVNFKRQMKMLGFSYDWYSEFSTTDPEYYKWTQWLFIQFFKIGLLYKKEIPVYYCPFCKTGLAEEEVLPDGTHERCQKPITRKTLPQWVFKITAYADRLLNDLKDLDWPQGILEMQKNWIGRSEGTEIKFKIKDEYINVFTTRADTLFGVTALVIAPEHWLVDEILNSKFKVQNSKLIEIKNYVEEAKRKLDLARTDLTKEKTGIDTGLKAIHPLTGEEIPIWIADYVIGWYGEGAVMVVPAHDERDFEFAKKFGLPIKQVIINSKLNPPAGGQNAKPQLKNKNFLDKTFTEYGILINSGEFNGLTSKEAIEKITQKLQSLNLGKETVTYKLRDWIFSRQRYWGEPIPMIFCQKCAKEKIDYWGSNLFKKNLRIGIFVDNANIFYGQKKSKLKIDIKKIKEWFSKEGDLVSFKYFVAIPRKNDFSYKKTISYLKKIEDESEIIKKPLKYIKTDKNKIIKKGDVDLELAISIIDNLDNIDVFVIFSGDSDYVVLRNYLLEKGKKVIFVSFKENISWEIKKGKYILINDYQSEFCFNKKTTSDKSRGLLLKLLYPQFFNLSIGNNFYGWFPISEDHLPLKLPYIKSYEPTETGESPLVKIKEFVNTTCPHCGGPAKRETDTMPNWAGSCWYFIRFAQNQKSKIKNQTLDQEWRENTLKNNWLPVDWYLGGAEHAVLHLLYARFWVKALYDLGFLDFKEPFLRLRNVGMVLAEDHRKMSKSFGNVINPDDVVADYGADTLRLYEMFMAPFNAEIAWSTKALQGCYRFLKRVWEIYQNQYQISNIKYQRYKTEKYKNLVTKLNKTIKKVTDDIKQIKFNTAIASMMEFVNEWEKMINNEKDVCHRDFCSTSPFKGRLPKSLTQNQVSSPLSIADAKKFLQILAPFAPFMTEEIWREIFGEKTSIHLSKWPEVQEVEDEEVVIPIQVNGKVRATIKIENSKIKNQNEIEKKAKEIDKVKKYLEGKKYKMIYVEGRVVNFVVIS